MLEVKSQPVDPKTAGPQFNADQGTGHKTATPWVLVAGGFHRKGGMDKANLSLAEFLVEQGHPVHIVCHGIDPAFAKHPRVTVHVVRRPIASFFLARPLLDWKGRSVARRVLTQWPDARVVVNGENCLWPDVNWVHCVHHAWNLAPGEAPRWFRAKQAASRWLTFRREKSAARIGRIFIANSHRTRKDLIELLGIPADRVHTIYLGAESEWGPVSSEERTAARESLGIPRDRPIAVFLGAIGFDRNKGFDLLLEAWRRLVKDPSWDVDLVMAGSGAALDSLRQQVKQYGLQERIRLLGFCSEVPTLLAAADVLVSPVRYEAYGLNVQEAICRGIPAIVSAAAGVSERYGPECSPLLLQDPENVGGLVETLWNWRTNRDRWHTHFLELGAQLRQYGWNDMARSIIAVTAEPGNRSEAAPATSGQN